MKKTKRIFIIIIACIISCACGAGIVYKIYGNGPKDITEMFFDPESREYIKNMTIYNNEKVELDDYTVTFENSIYDSEVGIGYLVFSVQQNDGGSDKLNKFVEKYTLMDYAAGTGNDKTITDGNKMYIYRSLEVTEWYPKEKDKILLLEKGQSEPIYRFNIESITNIKKYEYNDEIVILSPMGIRINKEEFTHPNNVILKYNDGTPDKTIVENGLSKVSGEYGGGIGGGNGKYAYMISFINIIDIKNVESVIIDGNEYKFMTE